MTLLRKFRMPSLLFPLLVCVLQASADHRLGDKGKLIHCPPIVLIKYS